MKGTIGISLCLERERECFFFLQFKVVNGVSEWSRSNSFVSFVIQTKLNLVDGAVAKLYVQYMMLIKFLCLYDIFCLFLLLCGLWFLWVSFALHTSL